MEVYRFSILEFGRSFFPFQLMISHFKHNLVGLFTWFLFFLIISGQIGSKFGVQMLFYSPEYLGRVSFWSFMLLGFGFGALLMAFNSYSYSKIGKRFPFLTFLKQPFYRFCINNALIPLVFVAYYLFKMIHHQWVEEFATVKTVLIYSCSFLGGLLLFVFFSLTLFFPLFNRIRLINFVPDKDGMYPFETLYRKKEGNWYNSSIAKADRRFLYFGLGFRVYLSRPVDHIDDAIVQKVLNRNRINTTFFELITVVLFVSVSLLADNKVFEMPAGMSIILLVTLLFMLYSVLQTWMRKWTPLVFILMICFMNYLSVNTSYFSYRNYAYGLDYQRPDRPEYSITMIAKCAQLESDKASSASYENYIELLDNWKKQTGVVKPKMVIVNSSGGGLRSALWTFGLLQKFDQEFNGQFKKYIHMYTGASGGMIGANYFRELCLRDQLGEIDNLYSKKYMDNLGKDMLNKLTFSASTRDLFLRVQTFKYGGHIYSKDRGQAFEEQLHANTDYFMDHTLGYYKQFEKDAIIPTMIITPTIINDGRRLLISAQSLGFLTAPANTGHFLSKSYENIDYQTYFKDMDPQSIRFSSVLRSSATFPFITPMVTLPTTPEVQLMDAGIRDNYGGKISMELLFHMKDWIKNNTSGVIILQLRDTKKILDNTTYQQVSLLNKFTLPFSNMYNNFPKTQDFDQDQLFKFGISELDFTVDVINFNLRERVNEQISLSWQLSTKEKNKIQQAFYSELNQQAFAQLKMLMLKK